MTLKTSHAALIGTAIIAGIAIAVGDLHRIVLSWAWPLLTSAFDAYIAF
jgi:hypothetical protein